MTLILSGDITLRRTWQPMDPDAAAYIAAVETADGQALEEKVKVAIDNFVLGCKADGIWDAIKASCILAGARTLSGALVPLVGAAPTNYNFVAGDYDRKTGLVGDGSTKYLNSNRNNNADPQDSKHLAVLQTTGHTRDITRAVLSAPGFGAGASALLTAETPSRRFFRVNVTDVALTLSDSTNLPGFWGSSRPNSSGYTGRYNGVNYPFTDSSAVPISDAITVFNRGAGDYSNARLAFYSIGESLDLALLDARVTDLINKFAEVIP